MGGTNSKQANKDTLDRISNVFDIPEDDESMYSFDKNNLGRYSITNNILTRRETPSVIIDNSAHHKVVFGPTPKKAEIIDLNNEQKKGCTCCGLFKKRRWNRIQLIIQFVCGVIPSVVYSPIMDAWQRQNESQPDHYGAHDIVHYLTRFGVIFFFVMNFARIWLDYLFPSYSLKRSVYRKFNRTLAMIMCCLLALNDRQLDKAFLADNSSPEKVGFTKHYYRHVFIGVMAFQLVAVLACIFINTEERFADKDAKATWKKNHKNKMKAKKAKIFGEW